MLEVMVVAVVVVVVAVVGVVVVVVVVVLVVGKVLDIVIKMMVAVSQKHAVIKQSQLKSRASNTLVKHSVIYDLSEKNVTKIL